MLSERCCCCFGREMMMLRRFVFGVFVVVVGMIFGSGCLGLRTEELFPFGTPQGDRRVAVEDDGSSPEVQLNTTVAFYDDRFRSLYVNLNGFLSFETEIPSYRSNMIIPFGYKIVAPFFADIDIRLSGNVFYRETFDPSLRGKASQDISRAFPSSRFHPDSLFVATWDRVGYFDNQHVQTNTFQLVIASDGRDSFALFLYPEGGINWIRGEGKEADTAQDPDAQAGFDAGDGRRYLTLPGSGNREVQNLPGWSNCGVSGLFIFHIGNTRGQNIRTPGTSGGGGGGGGGGEGGWPTVDVDGQTCADAGLRRCHSQATCTDHSGGFCCSCNAPYVGNGIDCIRPDEPLRISGKVSGTLNGVRVDNVDLHAYVVTSDGRTYTAISRMEYSLGQSLLSLYSVAGILGFLFSLPQQPGAKNGFMVTGYDFNRTTMVTYQPGRETVTIRQTLSGTDVPGHLRLATVLDGTIPRIADNARVEADDYREEYRRTGPGVLRMSSANNYRVDGVPHRFTTEETIVFRECSARPLTDLVSMKLAVSRNFFAYSESEQIVRYSQTNKVYLPGGGEDPCRSASCDARATCVAQQDSYTCICRMGFEGNGQQCRDIDECSQRTSDCHRNADCYNTEGSFQCRCRQGYTGDGRDCQESRSCYYLRNCGQHSECILDSRSQNYICQCSEGYDGDGYNCQPQQRDECTVDIDCDPNANCVYDAATGYNGCRCSDGYEGDGRTCSVVQRDCRRDQGVCARNARCIWDGTAYACRCETGYQGDGYHSCTVSRPSPGAYLMYTQGMYIMQTPFAPSSSDSGKQILFNPGQTAIGIDVDCYDHLFYWTDIDGKTINRANLNGSGSEVIIRGLNSPEGVAVDWIGRNLYWTDSGSDHIEVSRLDGTRRKKLVSSGLVNPRGIAVDPVRGFLFWTDWNRESPKIERSNMDGSDRRAIVSESLGLPNGLTIDFDSQLVCWSDAGTRRVECSSYDGNSRRTVANSAGYPFGLAYSNNVLYWTDWEKQNALPNANLLHGSRPSADLSLPVGGNGRMYGIATVKQRCPSGSNSCGLNNGGCRFLCLPSRVGRTCTCPDDIDPEECNRIALI